MAIYRSPRAVERCLRYVRSLEDRDYRGFTPLMAAVERGQLETVNVLLQAGADPNSITCDRRNSLHIVCDGIFSVVDMSRLGIITALLDAGVNVNNKDSDGNTPMHLLIVFIKNSRRSEDDEQIDEFITIFMDLLEKCLQNADLPLINDTFGLSLLSAAICLSPETEMAYRTSKSLIKLLVKYGADVSDYLNGDWPEIHLMGTFLLLYGEVVEEEIFNTIACVTAFEDFFCRQEDSQTKFPGIDHPHNHKSLASVKYLLNWGLMYYGFVKGLPKISGRRPRGRRRTPTCYVEGRMSSFLPLLENWKVLVKLLDEDDSFTAGEMSDMLIDLSPSNLSLLKPSEFRDLSRVETSTFTLYHLSRRAIRSRIFRNHTHQLPDMQKVSEELSRSIGPVLKVFL